MVLIAADRESTKENHEDVRERRQIRQDAVDRIFELERVVGTNLLLAFVQRHPNGLLIPDALDLKHTSDPTSHVKNFMDCTPILWGFGLGRGIWALLVSILAAAFICRKISLYLSRERFRASHGLHYVKRVRSLDPIFGLDLLLKETVTAEKQHSRMQNIFRDFCHNGATYSASMVGQNIIATIEPENIKTILSLKFNDYSLGNREEALYPLLGKGIFNADGELWAHSRAMIRPTFARDKIADLEATERHMQVFFECVPKDGSTVDLQELFFGLTIDTGTEFLFGNSISSLEDRINGGNFGSLFAQAFNEAQRYVALRIKLGVLRPFYISPKGKKAVHFCRQYIEELIDQHAGDLEKGHPRQGKYVLLHELAKETSDKNRLRDEVMNVLLAARDTTASFLSSLWFQLARNPEIYAKLRKEIVDELYGRPPTYEKLRKLKYLRYCMNETLRLFPPVPANIRLAIRDTSLPTGGGPDGTFPAFVPQGSILFYSVFGMHRRQDIYGADSEVFRPERWEALRPGWEYLPFNGGPRICLGQQYALTEAAYVTVRLTQRYKAVESRDPHGFQESMVITLSSFNGTKVALVPA